MNARDFRYYLRKYLKVTDKIIFKNVTFFVPDFTI